MAKNRSIILGLDVQETETGISLRSPDITDFFVYLEGSTISEALKILDPVMKTYMQMKGIDVQSVYVVLDGDDKVLDAGAELNPTHHYRMVIVPKPNFTPRAPRL